MPPAKPPSRPPKPQPRPLPRPIVLPPIAALPTGIALLVGVAAAGPVATAVRVDGRATFVATFGPPDAAHPLGWSVGHYFDNGGIVAWVVSLPADGFAAAAVACLQAGGAADAIDRFDLLCVPGLSDATAQAALQVACVACGAFLIADCDASATAADLAKGPDARVRGAAAVASALYAPWVAASDGAGGRRAFPPSGFVAGLYVRSDATRGIWHAPAGRDATLVGALAPSWTIDDGLGAVLNATGIDAIRTFAGVGVVAWGARTLSTSSSEPTERYVSLRRFATFVRTSLAAGLAAAAGRAGGPSLWAAVRATVDAFLHDLWRRGAMPGATPGQAWFVRCDGTTMSKDDLAAGRLVVLVGLATTRPAEFTTLRIVVSPRPQAAPA